MSNKSKDKNAENCNLLFDLSVLKKKLDVLKAAAALSSVDGEISRSDRVTILDEMLILVAALVINLSNV